MSDWQPIETCPENLYVNLYGKNGISLGFKETDIPVHPVFRSFRSPGRTAPGELLRRIDTPTHWQEIPIPDPPLAVVERRVHPWQNIASCPVDEEVWLIDELGTTPYVGKILKPSEFRAERTNVPLFYALGDRDEHPNPVRWAKKNNDSKPSAEPRDPPPAERSIQDYQSNLHAIHERLNTINTVLKKRFSDIDKQLMQIWGQLELDSAARQTVDGYTREGLELLDRKPWAVEGEKRKQEGRPSVIPYDPAKGMPKQATERVELHYTAKIHAEIRAISGVLVLMSNRLDRIEDRQKKIVDGKAPQPTSNLDETS